MGSQNLLTRFRSKTALAVTRRGSQKSMKTKQIVAQSVALLGVLLLASCDRRAAEPAIVQAPAFDPAAEFVALSSGEDATAEDWFALAQSAREAGDFATAGEALELAAKELSAPRVTLERARVAVARGEPSAAVELLQTMFGNGFTSVQAITGDSVLNSMAGTASFDELVSDMSKQAFPCEYDEHFRDFDFWIGSWDVHTANGQLAGHNRIERAERGCVLTEHWTNTAGGTGMSINYVDKTTDEWVQVWNSQGGSQINIRGGLTDDGMNLAGTIHYVANGTTAPFRGLWTPMPDGRVRQYFEQSNDGGETWVPWFEGFYSRQADADRR